MTFKCVCVLHKRESRLTICLHSPVLLELQGMSTTIKSGLYCQCRVYGQGGQEHTVFLDHFQNSSTEPLCSGT